MELLRTLTLIYAAVLVLALAASLIAIWIYLRRIAAALDEVHGALATASRESGPLSTHLQSLNETAGGSAEELADAQARLARAADGLAEVTG